MSAYHQSSRMSIVVDLSAPAGAVARELWEQLGRRRALVLSTKLRRLAELEPAWKTVTSQPRPYTNGHASPVIVIDRLADAAD
jgi:hypothetical protein